MVLFWKAQLDSRIGAAPEAARTLEEIVKERPTKELDPGLTLTAAAEAALANLAFASGDLDSAIDRFEDLKNGGAGTLGPGRPLAARRRLRRQGAVGHREAGDERPLERPQEPADRRRARRGRRHLPPPWRPCGRAGAARPGAQGQPDPPGGRDHPGLDAGRRQEARCGRRTACARRSPTAGEKPHAVFFLLLAAVENRMPPGRHRRRPCAGRHRPGARGAARTRSSWSRPGTSSSARPATTRGRRRLSRPGPRTPAATTCAACSSRSLSNKRTTPVPSGSSRAAQEEPQGFGARVQPGPAGHASGDRGGFAQR